MRILCLIPCFLLLCYPHEAKSREAPYSTLSYANSGLSRRLTKIIDRIEEGDRRAWNQFKSEGKDLDGEYSQTYSVACAEILTRDPTFFLRLYLTGDTTVIPYALRGYQWSGDQRRSLLNQIYENRIRIENAPQKKRLIADFKKLTCHLPTP